ncbi:MAG: hypothetical protein WBI17_11285 [Clostridiaceae bacterium]
MYNFNEQGKFESHDAAKEHSKSFEGALSYNGHRKSSKDTATGIFATLALISGIVLLIYAMKG